MEDLVQKLNGVFAKETQSAKEIHDALNSFQFCPETRAEYCHFDRQRYTRNLVTLNDKYSLLVMCWNAKQCTPLHDHGDIGITAHSRVIQGKLMLTRYSKATTMFDGDAFPYQVVDTKTYESDDTVCGGDKDLGFHVLQNPSDTETAISIHVYSPPYIECCYGKDGQDFVPVVYCAKKGHTLQTGARLDLQSKVQLNPVFLNMSQLVDLLRREIVINEDAEVGDENPVPHTIQNIEHVKKILKSVHLHPGEWRKYSNFEDASYTRNLIGYDNKFTALALCWNKGQMSPIHDHARSSCWVKVLEGEMQESLYKFNETRGECDLLQVNTLRPESGTAYINNSYGLHRMGNPCSDTVTVSLHIYSPPIKMCNVYLDNGATIKQVSLQAANGAVNEFLTGRGVKRCREGDAEDPAAAAMLQTTAKTDVLNELMDSLTCAVKAKDWTKVEELLVQFDLPSEEWETTVHFNNQMYTRNCLGYSEHFSLVLNCWNNGQSSPVHDHGDGDRLAFVKVMSGSVMLKRYDSLGEDRKEIPLSTRIINQGEKPVRLCNKALGAHMMANASQDHTAVSLHLYTPPYLDVYNEECGTQRPVSFVRKSSLSDDESGLATELDCCTYRGARKVYSNLRALTDLLRVEFSKCMTDGVLNNALAQSKLYPRIEACMKFLELNPREFQSYYKKGGTKCATYARSLVAFDKNFAVYLICWQPGQAAPVHDHADSVGWIRVLQGQLTDTRYTKDANGNLQVDGTTQLAAGSKHLCSHAEQGVIHSTRNASQVPAFSLHVYSPPYKTCTLYDTEANTSKVTCIDGIFERVSLK
eukprot:TRINITY_DN36762_c0_g1_i1.p1 TRINITY_DN36762_c0_g1~~TRINITY_DN36762_c0_g1_i1.p1  ORF type:complete len:812 (+),score=162.76 TRINITY_DN36762_c0_g1_i1:218-2653(+)